MTFKEIQEHALKLDRNEHIDEILKNAQLGARDVTAAERMLANVINDIQAFKIGLLSDKDKKV